MKSSTETNELMIAYANAKQQIAPVVKEKENSYFGSKYADLKAISDVCEVAIVNNGLCLLQTNDDCTGDGSRIQAGEVVIVSRLTHLESGQWLESRLLLNAKNPDAQGIGGACTYGQRYSLVTLMGVRLVDNDGETAVGRNQPQQYSKPAAVPNPTPKPTLQQPPHVPNAKPAMGNQQVQRQIGYMDILQVRKRYLENDTALAEVLAATGRKLIDLKWETDPAKLKQAHDALVQYLKVKGRIPA